jgi:hypothetical protein
MQIFSFIEALSMDDGGYIKVWRAYVNDPHGIAVPQLRSDLGNMEFQLDLNDAQMGLARRAASKIQAYLDSISVRNGFMGSEELKRQALAAIDEFAASFRD